MRLRLLKYLTPVLQPLYRRYISTTRKYRYGSIRIRVYPEVFYPGFIFSTGIFLDYLDGLDLSGKKLLEIGAGSGILSLLAARKGARVTATDINPAAIRNIRDNARSNDLGVTVIESDLFLNIPADHFDYLIVAPPYYPKDPENFAEMAWYCGSKLEYFEKFFSQLKDFHPGPDVTLMILSEDCDLKGIGSIAAAHGFWMAPLVKRRKMGELTILYRITRIVAE